MVKTNQGGVLGWGGRFTIKKKKRKRKARRGAERRCIWRMNFPTAVQIEAGSSESACNDAVNSRLANADFVSGGGG